ncbi:uncharacterized protein [Drosophila takahashii]|uniref:uncharacterized protein isoform X1 n=2 Tax=Drosophila takahashii TaxID=29030 RepID=UPI0038992C78
MAKHGFIWTTCRIHRGMDTHPSIWPPSLEEIIYLNYYGMSTRPIGTSWTGVATSPWTTVASGRVCPPRRAARFKRCDSAADSTVPGEIKARKKHAIEKDLGFLRIGSLNVRVKKTTEAFSNFLGVGNGSGVGGPPMGYGSGGGTGAGAASRPHHRSHRVPHQRHHHHVGTTRSRHPNQRAAMSTPYGTNGGLPSRASVPNNRNIYDGVHKSWGSADNIPHRSEDLMPPPKTVDYISKRNKSSKRSSYASNATDSPRDSICSSNSSSNLNGGYSSMPTTPNQLRAPKGIAPSFAVDSDSDSACGFDSSWSVNCRGSSSSNPSQS